MVRRAVPVLAVTGGVLVLVARFHTSPATNGIAAGEGSSEGATAAGPPSTLSAKLPISSTVPTIATTTTSTTTTTAPPGTSFDGPIASNKWGIVQVRVLINGGQIVDVKALHLPSDNSHSAALSREAAPKLRTEALQAQSAHIDVVSGATLTSESYMESLQGALDRAGRS